MSSKIKQYFANKENRIKCGITGGTIALAVIIFVGMVFMEENETQNNSIETVSQTESDTQTEEETGYSFDAGDLYDMRLDAQTIEDYYMKSCGDQFNLYTIDEDGVLWQNTVARHTVLWQRKRWQRLQKSAASQGQL